MDNPMLSVRLAELNREFIIICYYDLSRDSQILLVDSIVEKLMLLFC